MFLKRFIFVNWGNIPNLEFDLGPINLFSGGNGSGKTTAADAIQTVLTAAHDTLFHFNPGQDESSQRGRGKNVRTLASYVLGCDDGSYSRPGLTDGYVAAVFHPTAGESGEPFTALIGSRADLDKAGSQPVARLLDNQFLLINEELYLSHLQREDQQGHYILPLDQCVKVLRQELGDRVVEKYDTKKAYLCRLFGALRGREGSVSEREATGAARAFSRFMAYKPVRSINEFVAREVLEDRDLGDAIRSVSGLMKTIHGMEQEARRLRESISVLEAARSNASGYINDWIDFNALRLTEAHAAYRHEQEQYLKAKREQTRLRTAISENQNQSEDLQQQLERLRRNQLELEARRLGIDSLKDKDRLEASIQEQNLRLQGAAAGLLKAEQQRQHNQQAAELLQAALQQQDLGAELDKVDRRELGSRLAALTRRFDHDLQALVARDWVDSEALSAFREPAERLNREHELALQAVDDADFGGGISVREQLARRLHAREQEADRQQRERKSLLQEVERLEANRSNYPPFVREALDAIRSQCPEAEPRVLCDFVEVRDPLWQSAIEGYIGGARFGILVEEAYEAEAIRIVRRMPGKARARVIQGSKARLDAERMSIADNSIIHLLEFQHATARSYLTASFAGVLRVASAEELRHTRRGVTQDCMASGGYALYRCDLPDSDLVFGQGARVRALGARREALLATQTRAHDAAEACARMAGWLKAIDSLRPLDFAEQVHTLLSAQRQLQEAEQSLAGLDTSDYADLEQEHQALADKVKSIELQVKSCTRDQGGLENELASISRKVEQITARQEDCESAVEVAEEHLRGIARIWPEFDVDERILRCEQESTSIDLQQWMASREALESDLRNRLVDLVESLRDHNQHCHPSDSIAIAVEAGGTLDDVRFRAVCELATVIDQVHNRLKNNVLADKHVKLQGLKVSFDNTFVTNLCHSIYQAINEGKERLEELNGELEHHRFGTDRERYRFDWRWVPEYRDYWDFFREVIEIPNLGDGVTLFDVALSERGAAVRDKLVSMLLDEDEQKAFRELERISDYRNYRAYEIYKEVEGKEPIALSQYGTGSGGQLETPAYIIRAAAITAAFRFNEGDTHMRTVLVDEAFSKMDETRSREVLDYLTRTQGLQVIFVMPTSKSGPYLDLISNQFVFAKCPLPAGQQNGELATRVLVDRKVCHQERIRELWAHHRRTVREQVELDFMEGVA